MSYRPTVVVADDSETFLMYISIFLDRMHFEVIPVKTGADLLKISRVVRPDVIMLDVKMPDMDGLTTLRYIKNDRHLADLPVIMVSAESEKKTQDVCYDAGCMGYLTKPIKINEVNALIQKLNIGHRGKRKFLRASFEKNVSVTYNGQTSSYRAETLSERGIYIRKKDNLPVGSDVNVSLQLDDCLLSLKGVVIYEKALLGEKFSVPPGVAIQFKDLSVEDEAVLNNHVTNLLIGDIISEQEEAVIAVLNHDSAKQNLI